MPRRPDLSGLIVASALALSTSLVPAQAGSSNTNDSGYKVFSSLGAEQVDMMICLAADVSESVTKIEYSLQKQGHATAIADPRVVEIIEGGLHGKVAALYVEWADQDQQFLAADWHIIEDQKSAEQFARTIESSPPPPWIDDKVRNTSTSEVVRYCLRQFENAPGTSLRRVIDISSDGTNNVGRRVDGVRDMAVTQGVVINVLAIEDSMDPFPDGTHTRPLEGLVAYFENNVAGGTGSFVQRASGYWSFGEMIRKKFLLELADLQKAPASPRKVR